MSNKIDKLFNGKLADHTLTPSVEAWSRIESGLSKKNKLVIVWRAAAVFVLLGLLTGSWFYWQSELNERAARLATKKVIPNEINSDVKESLVTATPKEEPVQQVISTSNQKNKQPLLQKRKETQRPKVTIHEPELTLAIVEVNPINIETTDVAHVITKTEKPIVIEFTLDPVPSTTAIAQSTEEKHALKKIWDKALDIKNGEAELGGLRMAKNELFALDFRKDKSKRN
ncbi:MAG: hypothetical protein JNM78_02475 [Cyclobacteriaceae bacterium]|nr:hypothetical protein [Cyclobacteriaceae bacterium]